MSKEELKETGLFDIRISENLTPENSEFTESAGKLISLRLRHADGNEEFFERVVPIRAFPISAPDEYISIREPDTKFKGHGDEIGMIRKLGEFNENAQRLILNELSRRYFTPSIKKINSMHEKFGYSYWNVTTDAGNVEFIMVNPTQSIRTLEDGRVFMYDIDGNCFMIENPKVLDKSSYRKIEIYL